MSPHIIVLGKNYSTPLGVIRALGKSGYDVDALYIAGKGSKSSADRIVSASKYVKRLIKIDGRNDEKVLKALLEEYNTDKEPYVLFPTDDYSSSLIDRYREQLRQRFLMPGVVDGSIVELMDKTIQSRIARESGFQVPDEWVVSLNEPEISVPDDVKYPCFVKPMLSAQGGKYGLAKCGSRKELEKQLRIMQGHMRERSILIQEFINIEQEYTIGGVCRDQEIYLPAVIKKTRIAQHNRGVTLSGEVVSAEEISEVLPCVIRFLKAVRYIGMFDLEVHRTDKGFYFGELNLRCGGPNYAYFLAGVNLPETAVKAICGEDLDADRYHLNYGLSFINDKVAWEDYAYLHLSRKELKNLYKECDYSLLADAEDPAPEKMFISTELRLYMIRRFKNLIKKLIHRY